MTPLQMIADFRAKALADTAPDFELVYFLDQLAKVIKAQIEELQHTPRERKAARSTEGAVELPGAMNVTKVSGSDVGTEEVAVVEATGSEGAADARKVIAEQRRQRDAGSPELSR